MIQHADIKGRIPAKIFNFIAPITFNKLALDFEKKYDKILKKV